MNEMTQELLAKHMQRMSEIDGDSRSKMNENADLLTDKIKSTIHRVEKEKSALLDTVVARLTGQPIAGDSDDVLA